MPLPADRRAAWHLKIAGTVEAIGPANRSLGQFLEEQGVASEVVFSATLVLEEVVTNIAKYSYETEGVREIDLEARLEAGSVVIRVVDDGRPFDPRAAPPPDRDVPPEDRPVGGLGIDLVRNLTERIDYERADGRNVLTLFLSLEPKN